MRIGDNADSLAIQTAAYRADGATGQTEDAPLAGDEIPMTLHNSFPTKAAMESLLCLNPIFFCKMVGFITGKEPYYRTVQPSLPSLSFIPDWRNWPIRRV